MMGLLYLLFSKFVPMISMWELEAGFRKAPLVRRRAVALQPSGVSARFKEAEPLATDVSR
jgi:hypothetical protein